MVFPFSQSDPSKLAIDDARQINGNRWMFTPKIEPIPRWERQLDHERSENHDWDWLLWLGQSLPTRFIITALTSAAWWLQLLRLEFRNGWWLQSIPDRTPKIALHTHFISTENTNIFSSCQYSASFCCAIWSLIGQWIEVRETSLAHWCLIPSHSDVGG